MATYVDYIFYKWVWWYDNCWCWYLVSSLHTISNKLMKDLVLKPGYFSCGNVSGELTFVLSFNNINNILWRRINICRSLLWQMLKLNYYVTGFVISISAITFLLPQILPFPTFYPFFFTSWWVEAVVDDAVIMVNNDKKTRKVV